MEGKLVLFCGPSGSGKGTVEREFIYDKAFDFYFTVSATTRPIRENEEDGVDHWFIDKETFEQWKEEGRFLEHAVYVDNYYGTLRKEVEDKLAEGRNIFFELEPQGILQVIKEMPQAITIFLSPPSIEILEERLKGRGTEPQHVIDKRIETAKQEMDYANDKKVFKYNVINHDVNEAAEEIKEILRKELNV